MVNAFPLVQEASLSKFFTTKEAMEYLRVSRSTIHRLMASKQLRGHKVGSQWRYYQSDLAACVQGTVERSAT